MGKTNIGLSYGLLLTKVFEFDHVELGEVVRLEFFNYLDERSLSQSLMQVLEDETLIQLYHTPPHVHSISQPYQMFLILSLLTLLRNYEKMKKMMRRPP